MSRDRCDVWDVCDVWSVGMVKYSWGREVEVNLDLAKWVAKLARVTSK